MTGLYPARIGITAPVCHLRQVILKKSLQPKAPPSQKVLVARSITRLKLEYITLAELLHEAGYVCAHFGKWHLGHEPYDPLHQGFQIDIPHWPGPGPAGSYLAPWRFGPKQTLDRGKPGEHIEDRLSQEAVKFIRQHKNQPFFLNYWAFSVHGPWIAKPELVKQWRKRPPGSHQQNPVYAAMVQSLDEAVGRILTALEEENLLQKTVIIFFSDNGGVHWLDQRMRERFGLTTPPTSNWPLRGGKATIYEGGTRVPFIVVWPGHTAPGSVSHEVVSSVDLFPTILEIAGVKPPANQPCDGISIVPALKGKKLPDRPIFCHFPHGVGIRPGFQPSCYVRLGPWKLIRFFCDGPNFKDRYELYNLAKDLSESHNLADRYPERVKRLSKLLDQFLRDTKAVVPKPNPRYNPSCQRQK